jgi:Na+-translocating ferredoxin:NAD+ oxidoreductase RnfD subunit
MEVCCMGNNWGAEGAFCLLFLSLVVFAMLVGLVVIIIKTWIYCRIFSKAGYSWALGLLILVPIANIIIPFVLALGDWPVQKELRQLRQQVVGGKTQEN